MILTDIRLENYKQYGGAHDIVIRDEGMIAIIGANGTGKTTLFEAIEWCLYKPKTIANTAVRTRNGSGATKVIVRLTDPVSGAVYVVERRLTRSNVVEAAVYLADQPESRLASGTGDVSAYVARHLIGLNHQGFVATFFTRQKELSFFGNLGATDRRREVAGLLGHDSIVVAGNIMKEEASEAGARAAAAMQVHRNESEGRDFAAELAAAEVSVAAATTALEEAELAHRASSAALAAITANLDAARDVERSHNAFTQQITVLDGQHGVSVERQGAAKATLAALDEDAAKRPGLASLAALEPERLAIVQEHQREREREADRRKLASDIANLDQSERQLAGDMRSMIESSAPPFDIPGWTPSAAPGSVSDEAVSLLGVIDALPLEDAQSHANAIKRCREAIAARDSAAQNEARLREAVARAIREQEIALANGDPAALAAAADTELTRIREQFSDQDKILKGLREQIKRLEAVNAKLRAFDYTQACETCLRTYSKDEADGQIRVNLQALARFTAEVPPLSELVESLKAAGFAQRARVDELNALAADAQALAGRIASIRDEHERASATLADSESAVRETVAAAGLTAEPDAAAARIAAERVSALARMANNRGALERILRDARAIAASRDRIASEQAALGPSRYDRVAHEQADAALQQARAAAVSLHAIDERLARRPVVEEQLQQALDSAAAILRERARVEEARAALGFDPLALAAMAEEANRAAAAERMALVASNSAETALGVETANQTAILRARDRVAALAEDGNRLQREADDVARMRDGFRDFEKYVAQRVNPILGERTAEFLALVTDGAYDQVEFDADYGLHIYDDDRPFPVSEFSGGERDVAALCARLALSTVIGDQAAHPPGFVVLDEVFGSLDQERRSLVLDTLRNLTGQGHALRQLFVISHVEEVNSSPLVDEVWRITSPNGVSKLEQDPRDGTITPEAVERLLFESD